MSSSRRTTGEINILAMLDGHAPGRRRGARRAMAWYGAAGVLACSLLVALAWLVRGASTPARDSGAAAQASTQPARSVRPAPASRDPGLDAGAPRDNVAVDLPALRAPLTADGPVTIRAPDRYASPARGAVIVDMPQPAAATAPTPALAVAAVPALPRPQPATARHPATHAAVPASPSARALPPYRTNSPQALTHADPAAPRPKRATAASRTAPPATTVDTDVALISAILQHTGARNEAADGAGTAACADKACGPRMPTRQ
jgi:hypothetical protein